MSKTAVNVPTLLFSVIITIMLIFVLMFLMFPTSSSGPYFGYRRFGPVRQLPVYPSYVVGQVVPPRFIKGRRLYL